jgi:hypothetical protein
MPGQRSWCPFWQHHSFPALRWDYPKLDGQLLGSLKDGAVYPETVETRAENPPDISR